MQIALANIANNNYDEALKWINLYEVSGLDIDSIDNAKFLIDINRNNDLETIKNYFSKNYINFDKINNQHTLESIDVLVNFLNLEKISVKKIPYDNILDIRSMPSYFLIKDIKSEMNLLKRAHRFAGFTVLKSLDIPSVLIEMGYLSNKEDSKLLVSNSYQKKITSNIVKAVKNYFDWIENNN